MVTDVARALRYLHARHICHGDVYAHNVLARTGPGQDGSAVLCDYGGPLQALPLRCRCCETRVWPESCHSSRTLEGPGSARQLLMDSRLQPACRSLSCMWPELTSVSVSPAGSVWRLARIWPALRLLTAEACILHAGASFFYQVNSSGWAPFESQEARAYGLFVQDVADRTAGGSQAVADLRRLCAACLAEPRQRPSFAWLVQQCEQSMSTQQQAQ